MLILKILYADGSISGKYTINLEKRGQFPEIRFSEGNFSELSFGNGNSF